MSPSLSRWTTFAGVAHAFGPEGVTEHSPVRRPISAKISLTLVSHFPSFRQWIPAEEYACRLFRKTAHLSKHSSRRRPGTLGAPGTRPILLADPSGIPSANHVEPVPTRSLARSKSSIRSRNTRPQPSFCNRVEGRSATSADLVAQQGGVAAKQSVRLSSSNAGQMFRRARTNSNRLIGDMTAE